MDKDIPLWKLKQEAREYIAKCDAEHGTGGLTMEENRETPKAVIYESDGYADGAPVYDAAHCPVCGYEFEAELEPWGRKYCPECGQRIKWEG